MTKLLIFAPILLLGHFNQVLSFDSDQDQESPPPEKIGQRLESASVRQYLAQLGTKFKHLDEGDLRTLGLGGSDSLAIAAYWEITLRNCCKERSLSSGDSCIRNLDRFIGFLEGRLAVRLPDEFLRVLLNLHFLSSDDLRFGDRDHGDFAKISLNTEDRVFHAEADVALLDGKLTCVDKSTEQVLWTTKIPSTSLADSGTFPSTYWAQLERSVDGNRIYLFGLNDYVLFFNGFNTESGEMEVCFYLSFWGY